MEKQEASYSGLTIADLFGRRIIRMKLVYPFQSVAGAIHFYLNNNPARQKYQNHAEPESDSAESVAERLGGAPHDIWASVALAIARALKEAHKEKYWSFVHRWITPRDVDCSWDAIADHMGISKRKVKRYCWQVEDDILKQLIRRELIPRSEYDKLKKFSK